MHIDVDNQIDFSPGDFIAQGAVVLGVKGSGKSNTIAVLIEEAAARLPFIVLDPHGEYWTLKERFDVLVIGRSDHVDLEVDAEKVGDVIALCYERGVSVVLDLLFMGYDEREEFVVACFQRLWQLAIRQRRPYCVVLEEAHRFIPEKASTPSLKMMTQIALEGRKFGLGMVLCTQATVSISKLVLRQMGIRFLHRVYDIKDIKTYQDAIPREPAEVKRMVNSLQTGQAIVVKNHQPQIVQMRLRETSDAGNTPNLGDVKLRAVDGDMLVEMRKLLSAKPTGIPTQIGEAVDDSELVTLRARVSDLEQQLADQETEIAASYEARIQEMQIVHTNEVALLNKQLSLARQPIAAPVAVQEPLMMPDAGVVIEERTETIEIYRSSVQLKRVIARQTGGFNLFLGRVQKLKLGYQTILAMALTGQVIDVNRVARQLDYTPRYVREGANILFRLGLLEKVHADLFRPNIASHLNEDYPDLKVSDLVEQLHAILPK